MGRYIVTGAAGGMGGAVCKALYEAGHEVIGLDVSPSAEETPWRTVRADVTDPASVDAAFDIIGDPRGIDGIVHAAGLYGLDSLVEISEDELLRIFNVNLFGVYRVNRRAVPLLNKGARIVIITSELAPLSPLPFTGLYAVTKKALDGYAAALAAELQLIGCGVVVVRPGAVRTDMLPASVRALDSFCGGTKLYPVNARRFKKIVGRVEARSVAPERVAGVIVGALKAKRPRLVYGINRNPLLLMLNALPRRLQLFIIRKLLS